MVWGVLWIMKDLVIHLFYNQKIKRDDLLSQLVGVQYVRNDIDFHRGVFRVRGDSVDIFPPHEDQRAFRIEFFGDYIDGMSLFDPITGGVIEERKKLSIYPGHHYVSTKEKNEKAIESVQQELKTAFKVFKA